MATPILMTPQTGRRNIQGKRFSTTTNEAVCPTRQSSPGPTTVELGTNASVNLSNKHRHSPLKKTILKAGNVLENSNGKPNPKNRVINVNVVGNENEAQPSSTNFQQYFSSGRRNTAQAMSNTYKNVSSFHIDVNGYTSGPGIGPPVPSSAHMSEPSAQVRTLTLPTMQQS